MNILIVLILLVGTIAILFIIKNQKGHNIKKKNISLKELVKETFPKYKIIEKHQTIMICEINHRNEPDELVFIRINSNKPKSIKYSGRMMIIDYPFKPNSKELKIDINKHLK